MSCTSDNVQRWVRKKIIHIWEGARLWKVERVFLFWENCFFKKRMVCKYSHPRICFRGTLHSMTFISRCQSERVIAHHITSAEPTESPTAHPNTIKLRAALQSALSELSISQSLQSTRLTFLTASARKQWTIRRREVFQSIWTSTRAHRRCLWESYMQQVIFRACFCTLWNSLLFINPKRILHFNFWV